MLGGELIALELGRGVDRDEPGDLPRVCGRVEAGDQAAEGVSDQQVGTGDSRGAQQRVQVGDRAARGHWLRDRIAAARSAVQQAVVRAIVRADAGEPGDASHHRRPPYGQVESRKEVRHQGFLIFDPGFFAPDVGRVAVPRYEDHRGPSAAATLEVDLATTANLDAAGEVAALRSGRLAARRPDRVSRAGRRREQDQETGDGEGQRKAPTTRVLVGRSCLLARLLGRTPRLAAVLRVGLVVGHHRCSRGWVQRLRVTRTVTGPRGLRVRRRAESGGYAAARRTGALSRSWPASLALPHAQINPVEDVRRRARPRSGRGPRR